MEDLNRLRILGAQFRGVLNDLKRRPCDAAAELGVPEQEILDVIEGRRAPTEDLIQRAVVCWPVAAGEFAILEDDAPTGIRLMRAAESERSGRVMHRGGKPYYEYRDTVMSRIGLFRPEWIRELCVVKDSNPRNPDVHWNNGHFLHQFTYFVGPVNFYYADENGQAQVCEMETGDSMYIAPYVAHTFATRANSEGRLGLILALTYGDKLAGDARRELAALGQPLAMGFAMDFTSTDAAAGSLLRFYRESLSLPVETLARESGIPQARIMSLETGKNRATADERTSLAGALRVDPWVLEPPSKLEPRVRIVRSREARTWRFPEPAHRYEVSELACTSRLSHAKGLRLQVTRAPYRGPDLKCGLHQYVYNVGTTAVTLHWTLESSDSTERVEPGDSLYIKPFVPHGFSGEGTLLVLRIGGRLAGEPMREFSQLGAASARRALGETSPWFNEEGKAFDS